MLVSMAARQESLRPSCGSYPLQVYKDELAAYGTSKGSIRFQPDRPLPAALVRKLVKTGFPSRRKRAGK